METPSVAEQLEEGDTYQLLLKMGTDGQTGRGNFAIKGKKVRDNKR